MPRAPNPRRSGSPARIYCSPRAPSSSAPLSGRKELQPSSAITDSAPQGVLLGTKPPTALLPSTSLVASGTTTRLWPAKQLPRGLPGGSFFFDSGRHRYLCDREDCYGMLAPLPPLPNGELSHVFECNACGQLKKEEDEDEPDAGDCSMDQ